MVTLEEQVVPLLERFNLATEELLALLKNHSKSEVNHLYFKHIAPHYDAHMEETNHFEPWRRMLPGFLDLIRGPLLDVGCGTGEILLYLVPFLNEHKIAAIANDISDEMRAIAKQKLEGKIENIIFTRENIASLPSDLKVGTVLCSYSMHHFPKPKTESLRSMCSVLRPGGVLVLIDEYPASITFSQHMPLGVAGLLQYSLQPFNMVTSDWVIQGCGFQPILGRINETFMPIDEKHDLYIKVFQKPG